MTEIPWDWQTNAVRDLIEHKTGIISAKPGAGKTLAGLMAVQKILELYPLGPVMVLVPTTALKSQWLEQVKIKIDSPDARERITIHTFAKVGRNFNESSNLFREKQLLIIVDESHRSHSPVFSNIYKLDAEYWLALSATPSPKDIEKFGRILVDLSWEEAKLSEFQLNFIGVDLTPREQDMYRQYTERIKAGYRQGKDDKDMMFISLQRRDIVHRAKNKLDCALSLIMQNRNRRMMIFGERIAQIDYISSVLNEKNIPHAILHSDRDDNFKEYMDKKINILLSSRMLREGFNDPSAEIGIIISFPLTRTTHVQTIGRLVRYMAGKNAQIYYVIANGTTDEKLISEARKSCGDERVNILPEYDSEDVWNNERFKICQKV